MTDARVDRASGAEDRFRAMFARHHPAVFGYAVRRVGRTDAPDVAADAFTIAWRRMRRVPEEPDTLPWLYGVARRVLSQQWRTERRWRRLGERARAQLAPPSESAEMAVVHREEHRLVRQALAELRSPDREVLRLAAWEGLSHAQIAATLGCSLAAVDKRVVRAKARLAEEYRALTADTLRRRPRRAHGGGGP